MANFQHKNFAIDEFIDRQMKACFDEMVQYEMTKVDSQLDEEMKRKIAIGAVLVKKEELKLIKKRIAARKSGKKPLKRLRNEDTETEDSLLKQCLLKQHREKKRREKEIRKEKEIAELHEEAKRLEEYLAQFFSE